MCILHPTLTLHPTLSLAPTLTGLHAGGARDVQPRRHRRRRARRQTDAAAAHAAGAADGRLRGTPGWSEWRLGSASATAGHHQLVRLRLKAWGLLGSPLPLHLTMQAGAKGFTGARLRWKRAGTLVTNINRATAAHAAGLGPAPPLPTLQLSSQARSAIVSTLPTPPTPIPHRSIIAPAHADAMPCAVHATGADPGAGHRALPAAHAASCTPRRRCPTPAAVAAPSGRLSPMPTLTDPYRSRSSRRCPSAGLRACLRRATRSRRVPPHALPGIVPSPSSVGQEGSSEGEGARTDNLPLASLRGRLPLRSRCSRPSPPTNAGAARVHQAGGGHRQRLVRAHAQGAARVPRDVARRLIVRRRLQRLTQHSNTTHIWQMAEPPSSALTCHSLPPGGSTLKTTHGTEPPIPALTCHSLTTMSYVRAQDGRSRVGLHRARGDHGALAPPLAAQRHPRARAERSSPGRPPAGLVAPGEPACQERERGGRSSSVAVPSHARAAPLTLRPHPPPPTTHPGTCALEARLIKVWYTKDVPSAAVSDALAAMAIHFRKVVAPPLLPRWSPSDATTRAELTYFHASPWLLSPANFHAPTWLLSPATSVSTRSLARSPPYLLPPSQP